MGRIALVKELWPIEIFIANVLCRLMVIGTSMVDAGPF
jgi:hypothetical protein